MTDSLTGFVWEVFCVIVFSFAVVFVYTLYNGAYTGTENVGRAGKQRYALTEDTGRYEHDILDTGVYDTDGVRLTPGSKVYYDIIANSAASDGYRARIVNDTGSHDVTKEDFVRTEERPDDLTMIIFEMNREETGEETEIKYNEIEPMYRMDTERTYDSSTGETEVVFVYTKAE